MKAKYDIFNSYQEKSHISLFQEHTSNQQVQHSLLLNEYMCICCEYLCQWQRRMIHKSCMYSENNVHYTKQKQGCGFTERGEKRDTCSGDIVQVAVFIFHWKFVAEMFADVGIFPIFLPLAWYL